MCPVINLGRVQHLGATRHEHAPDCPLHRPAALRRRVRFFAQVWMVWPFRHDVPPGPFSHSLPLVTALAPLHFLTGDRNSAATSTLSPLSPLSPVVFVLEHQKPLVGFASTACD